MYKGKIYKDGKFWLVEVPELDLLTQGHTKKEAYVMLNDWLKTAIGEDFKSDIAKHVNNTFLLEGRDDASKKSLIALMLKRQRERAGLTLEDMRQLLSAKSRNTYARYEQGKFVPNILMLDKIFHVMGMSVQTRVREKKHEEDTTAY